MISSRPTNQRRSVALAMRRRAPGYDRCLFLLVVLCLWLYPGQGESANLLQQVRFGSHGALSRVVFDFQEDTAYQVLPSQERLTIVVEFPRFLPPLVQVYHASDPFIREVRFLVTLTTIQGEITLKQPGRVTNHFRLGAPPRIVIDITRDPAEAIPASATASALDKMQQVRLRHATRNGQEGLPRASQTTGRPPPAARAPPDSPAAPGKSWLDEISEGLSSSFALPLGDLLKPQHPSEWRNLLHGVSLGIALDYPLKSRTARQSVGRETQGEQVGNSATLRASLRYTPLSYWFGSTTFYTYLDPDSQASWEPDFTYSFGYDDWHPYTLSLVYSNYGGNRLHPKSSQGERFTHFNQGTVSLGWKFPVPRFLEDLSMVHPSGQIGCGINYNVTPEYTVADAPGTRRWKQSASLNCRYRIYGWWYVNATVYYYPWRDQQQPWDSDFTYGFGSFDFHPGTFSVQYNNYSGTRFPWRRRSPNTGTFRDGSVMISWSWSW